MCKQSLLQALERSIATAIAPSKCPAGSLSSPTSAKTWNLKSQYWCSFRPLCCAQRALAFKASLALQGRGPWGPNRLGWAREKAPGEIGFATFWATLKLSSFVSLVKWLWRSHTCCLSVANTLRRACKQE